MKKKLSEEQLKKIEYLNKRCHLILDFIHKVSQADQVIEKFKLIVNNAYDAKDLKGLLSTSKFMDDWASELLPAESKELKQILEKELGASATSESKSEIEAIKKIIEKGKIENNKEYKMVLDKVEKLYKFESNKKQVEILNRLLTDYHKT
jgi:hypothetical protein